MVSGEMGKHSATVADPAFRLRPSSPTSESPPGRPYPMVFLVFPVLRFSSVGVVLPALRLQFFDVAFLSLL